MFLKLFSYFFNRKIYKKFSIMENIVREINNLEKYFVNFSDIDLKNNTYRFRDLILSGKSIYDFLPEAFATVREASKRVFGIRHFDVQLLGGIVLNNGCIAEMKTGEGKTLTSTLPAYLNALVGKGVHIVTVNEYLAKRDSELNSKLFNFLDITVGLNLSGMSLIEKKKAYLADITYGTNNEYGFDYLRDNMVFSVDDKVQRDLYYAIIDEVDSILIDEARTPLVISGSIEFSFNLFNKINNIIPFLVKQDKEDNYCFKGSGDFVVDKKYKQIFLTERGILKVENLLVSNNLIDNSSSLYQSNNIMIMHYVISSLKAHFLYKRNVDYLVKNNQILIVDEHTGRIMHDRRWSDGLHQAIEAKENVYVNNENQSLASITFQNYFRLYKKLSGMTGTAITESLEFSSIYNLDTISIPTNKPIIRKDYSDLVYLTEKEKYNAIIEDIIYRKKINQPVLVGTISIEKSEYISSKLYKLGIEHNVLNAKFHKFEAGIISQAGKPSMVTIATNMAGRGTDIILGGNIFDEIYFLTNENNENINIIKNEWKVNHDLVVSLGGLHIIGTERHESRRIDNQLRGRSGRQGDPGSSRFYVSMDDSLMRIFISEKVVFFMRNIGINYGESIEHNFINKSIEKAQSKIENRNFDFRKQLLEYDDIVNEQRKIIYLKRNKLLFSVNLSKYISKLILKVVNLIVINIFSNKKKYIVDDYVKKLKLIYNILINDFNIKFFYDYKYGVDVNNLKLLILKSIDLMFKEKEKILGEILFLKVNKNVMLYSLDYFWKEYLYSIDSLKESINLYSYAQIDPIQEYKIQSYKLFSNMLKNFNYQSLVSINKIIEEHDINFIKENIDNQRFFDKFNIKLFFN